jgi:hypothetical protein
MGGPSIKTLNPASQPSLTQPGLNLLQGIFGGGQQGGQPQGGQGSPSGGGGLFGFLPGFTQQGFGGMFGQGTQNNAAGQLANRPSPLAGQPGGLGGATAFGNMQGAFGSPLSPGISNTLQQFASGPNPGMGVVNAYQPIFQRNLATAMDTGPRFSSGNDLLRTQAMNDYNMFAQQALLGGQQQQIGAALGLGGLQNQAQLPLMQQLLGALFTGGGINSGPIYNVSPGFGQQMLGLVGSIAGGRGLSGGGGQQGGGGGGADFLQSPLYGGV